ncbi:hypothetical protein Tco_1074559, partial [Tanacetum coccineum]
MDDVLVDPDAEENFVAAVGISSFLEVKENIAAAEQATRIDAPEQATNTS